jgi:uncharacterized protein (DUF2147 family)
MRFALFATLAMLTVAGPALAADPVEGLWLIETGRAKVLIAPCETQPAKLCGHTVWLKTLVGDDGKPRHDQENPNPARRGDPLMGMQVIRDFRQAAPSRWTGGKIYDPNTGKTYDAKLRLNPNGTLKVEGCVLIICQAQTWTRTS